jgi:cullin-associated NEDD8-dissociated protein 1
MLEGLMLIALPAVDSMEVVSSTNSLSPFVQTIYEVILYRLEPVDIDQEIKESAISCTSQFLCTFGSEITQDQRETLVSLLQKRLDNEPSRISALKAFSLISAHSTLTLHLPQQLNTVLCEIAVYLKQNNRLLKQTTLGTLFTILKFHAQEMTPASIQAVLRELPTVFHENDLNIIDSTLQVLSLIFQNFSTHAQVLSLIQQDILPRVYDLACSSWIYGIAQKSLISLLQLFTTSDLPLFSFHDLESQLISHFQNLLIASTHHGSPSSTSSPGGQSNSGGSSSSSSSSLNIKQSLTNLSLCLASICLSSSLTTQHQTILKYVNVLEKNLKPDTRTTATSLDGLQDLATNKYFSFLCLGFIGQHLDIRPILAHKPSINFDSLLFTSLSTDSDDMKSLISHTLAYLSIGNLSYYVPVMLAELNRQPSYQYYLLMAFREMFLIASKEAVLLDEHIEAIEQNLFHFLSAEEENLRNILSESIGSLMVLYPQRLIQLINHTILSTASVTVTPTSIHAILTLTNSMKYFFSRYVAASAFSSAPGIGLPSFEPVMNLLTSDDLEILKSLIQMVNSAVHYNVALIREYLTPVVIGKVIEVLGKKAERIIDLGPFKHRVRVLPLCLSSLSLSALF